MSLSYISDTSANTFDLAPGATSSTLAPYYYTAPYTGAVQQSVIGKLSQLLSVTDFGAVGDGVTDDTGAIQNALNSGVGFYFESGKSYLISDVLTLSYSNMHIFGNNCTIIQSNQLANYIFYSNVALENITLTNFNINGGGSFTSAFSNPIQAIYFTNTGNKLINIINNYISGCNYGIFLAGGLYHTVDQNTIIDGGMVGIRIQNINASHINSNIIKNMQGGQAGSIQFGDGIYTYSIKDCEILFNDISECVRIGIVGEGDGIILSQRNKIISNNIYDLSGSISPENNYGVWIEGGTADSSNIITNNGVAIPADWTGNKYGGILSYCGGTICNNNIISSSTDPIDGGGIIFAGGDAVIANNYIKGTSVGIYNSSQESATTGFVYNIKNNIIRDCLQYGIYIYRCGTTFFMEDNTIIDNGSQITINNTSLYAGAGIYIQSSTANTPKYTVKNNTFISSVNENDTTGQIYGIQLTRSAGGSDTTGLIGFDNNTFIYTGTISTAYPNNLTFSSSSTVIPVALGYDSGSGVMSFRRDIVKDTSNNKSSKLPNGIANTMYPTLVDLQVSSGNQRHVGFGSAAPSGSIPAQVGDFIYNTSIASAGNMGWICTTAGTPGTWQKFGQIGYSTPVTGTWNPSITFATTGDLAVTYSTRVGEYTQFGNFIIATLNIVTSAFTWSTASGALQITGLPSPVGGGNTTTGAAMIQGITKAGYTQFTTTATSGQSFLRFYGSGSGQLLSQVVAADMPSGGTVQLYFTIVYFTS